MRDIQVGDVVGLASGGPKMTVSSIVDDERVDCAWFTEIGTGGSNCFMNHPTSNYFAKAALVVLCPADKWRKAVAASSTYE